MNVNTIFLKSFRVLLLPFAVLYGLVVFMRNWLFDKKYLHSAEFNFPLICVGNLSVGGTGKSPMVEYIIEILHEKYVVGTLSRGYKRKTKGYTIANETTTALEIGDEPMQFHLKFPDVAVAVGEERLVAIPYMLQDRPNLQAIVLDDAFQHRSVCAGLNIILTDYNNLYFKDFFLPTGDLRDQWSSAKRAQIIIVTKCPDEIEEDEKQRIIYGLHPLPNQKVFFTSIEYGIPYHIYHHNDRRMISTSDEVLLVCGIANPKQLKELLHEQAATYYQKDYSDHHIFTIDDLDEIKERFKHINTENKFILTTEKDAVRLIKFTEELKDIPLYVIPIRPHFLFDGEKEFNSLVESFVHDFTFKSATPNEQE